MAYGAFGLTYVEEEDRNTLSFHPSSILTSMVSFCSSTQLLPKNLELA